jgi:endonuclease/exonuclease/phosphatase (EEP) superfamily protein YafD
VSAPVDERHRTDVRSVGDRSPWNVMVDTLARPLLVALALVTGSRWIDAPRSRFLPLLQALASVVAAPTWAVLLAATAARRWRLAGAAGALAAVHAGRSVAHRRRRRRDTDAGSGDRLVVLSANLQHGRGDPAAIVEAVKTRDVDLLALVEVTHEAHAGLLDAGITALLPHATGWPRTDARAVMVFSRNPLRRADVPTLPPVGYGAALTAVVARSGDVIAAVVHPVTPLPGHASRWHRELADLAVWAASVPAGVPVVLAGDFNATPDHPVLRRLGDAGFRNAHHAAGRRRPATWPRVPGLSRLSPIVQIDHVQVRDLDVVDAGTLVIPGSDHLAVWAELAPPRR